MTPIEGQKTDLTHRYISNKLNGTRHACRFCFFDLNHGIRGPVVSGLFEKEAAKCVVEVTADSRPNQGDGGDSVARLFFYHHHFSV